MKITEEFIKQQIVDSIHIGGFRVNEYGDATPVVQLQQTKLPDGVIEVRSYLPDADGAFVCHDSTFNIQVVVTKR